MPRRDTPLRQVEPSQLWTDTVVDAVIAALARDLARQHHDAEEAQRREAKPCNG